MPADASNELTRRDVLGIPDADVRHVSSLLVRAHPARLDAVVARIARLSVAEVATSDPSGKIVVTLETRDENEIVAAMNSLQQMAGVVSVALVYHQSEV